MNRDEADRLFRREAMLFGDTDGVLEEKAEELFGSDAVAYVHKLSTGGEYWSAWGIDGFIVQYLTLKGFRNAASYRNAQLLKEKENAAPVLAHQDGRAEQVLTDTDSASNDT